MGNIQFKGDKILFTATGVAMDPACCCGCGCPGLADPTGCWVPPQPPCVITLSGTCGTRCNLIVGTWTFQSPGIGGNLAEWGTFPPTLLGDGSRLNVVVDVQYVDDIADQSLPIEYPAPGGGGGPRDCPAYTARIVMTNYDDSGDPPPPNPVVDLLAIYENNLICTLACDPVTGHIYGTFQATHIPRDGRWDTTTEDCVGCTVTVVLGP